MTAQDLYKVFSEYQDVFIQKGFSKKAQNKYKLDNNNLLTFQLDKWGWDTEYGSGFFARLSNPNADSSSPLNIFESELDIKPSQLIAAGRIKEDDFSSLYTGRPKTKERTILGLYAYYDEDHLRKLLDLTLEPLLDEVIHNKF